MGIIGELKRRNVIRAAGLYLIGAWLVVQVAGTILPMFGAADWIARSIVIALTIGFIPAMVVAWVFELTPDGLKRDAEVTAAESIAPQTARRMQLPDSTINAFRFRSEYESSHSVHCGQAHRVPPHST